MLLVALWLIEICGNGVYPVRHNSMACSNGACAQHSLGMVFGGNTSIRSIAYDEMQELQNALKFFNLFFIISI
jgi:hypothetical protein